MSSKILFLTFLSVLVSCGKQKEEHNNPLSSSFDAISMEDAGPTTSSKTQDLANRLILLDKKIEYECYEPVFSATLNNLNGQPKEEFFSLNHWTHNLCITATFTKISSVQLSIDDINVWMENDFNNPDPKTQKKMIKIIKLPLPLKTLNGHTGSTLKIQFKGKQEESMNIEILSAIPKNLVSNPAIFDE